MSDTLTSAAAPHEARLNFRLSRSIKERVEKAAQIAGMSVSDFAVSRLAAAADEVLTQHNRLLLETAERDFFLSLLAEPDREPTAEARRAAADYNAWSSAQ